MSWQVAIEAASRQVIAIGSEANNYFPDGSDFGTDYPIFTIDDDAELAVLLKPTDPAYLSLDNHHVLAQAP